MTKGYKFTTEDRQAIVDTATRLGVSPAALTMAMGYETEGTMNPDIRGGAHNAYEGLIQMGPSERKQFGYRPGMTVAEQVQGPVYNYLKARGLQPGMGLAHIYSIINAGSLTRDGQPRWNARDQNGTVREHVQRIAAQLGKGAPGNFTPPMNVGETAQGRQMPLGIGRGRISSGPEVAKLQQRLTDLGFNPGPIDGTFGKNPATSRTAAAVRAAEIKYGLPTRDSGVAGPQVLSALETASHPAYEPGGGVMPAGFQQPQRPITPTPPSTVEPLSAGLQQVIDRNSYRQSPPGAVAAAPPPASYDTPTSTYVKYAAGMGYPGVGQPPVAAPAASRGPIYDTPTPTYVKYASGMGYPGAGQPPAAPGFDTSRFASDPNAGGMAPIQAPTPATTAPVSINDVAATAAGIPNALGLGDWFGSSPVAAAPLPPPAVSPGGSYADDHYGAGLSARPYPSGVPYSPPQQTPGYSGSGGDNYLMGSGGPFTGTPYRVPSSSYAGNPYDFTGGGASAAGAAEAPVVTPAGGEPFRPSMYNVPPDPGTGGSAAMIQPYAGFTPPSAYTPPPAVRLAPASSDPVQQATQAAQTGSGHGGAGYGGGGGNSGGGYFGQSPGAYSYAGMTPWGSPSYTTPSGGYSNSPYTPSGYQAPNFSSGSGGPTYAYKPDGYGGGTFVDSHGNIHSY